jgi:hypothetical protein
MTSVADEALAGLSYRDDLQSLAYTVLRLARGNLPWALARLQLYDDKIHVAVQALKAEIPNAWLFERFPREMADLHAPARPTYWRLPET